MTAHLLNGECLEIMRKFPDKSIDCFICDLPYGCLVPSGSKKFIATRPNGDRTAYGCDWDVKIDLVAFWEQVERLARNDKTPVVMFCTTRFGNELINSKPKWYRYDLVWDKQRGISFLDAGRGPLRSHEMIYVFSKKSPYYKRKDYITPDKKGWTSKEKERFPGAVYGRFKEGYSWKANENTGTRCVLSVLPFKKTGKMVGKHPTEKPEELYRFLLERYCPPGGTVLDPTAGSFNSIKVARELGLRGIGIEMEKKYYEKAVKALLTPEPAPVNTVIYMPEEEAVKEDETLD